MNSTDYSQQMKETLTLAKEYIATYRYFRARIKSVPFAQRQNISDLMTATYEAWLAQLKKYARLTQQHCEDMDGTAFPGMEETPA